MLVTVAVGLVLLGFAAAGVFAGSVLPVVYARSEAQLVGTGGFGGPLLLVGLVFLGIGSIALGILVLRPRLGH